MVPKTSPGDARVLILAWTDGLGRATADYVGLTALFPFSVRFSLIYRERASNPNVRVFVEGISHARAILQ